MSIEDKAFEIDNALVIINQAGESSPAFIGGTSSPVGTADALIGAVYFQKKSDGFTLWSKFGTGINDWFIKTFIASGLIREFFSENTSSFTTSDDWVTRLDETTIGLMPGDYLILFGLSITNSSNNKTVGARIRFNEETISEAHLEVDSGGDHKTLAGVFLAANISGEQQFRVDFGQTTAGGVAEIKNITIGYIKVG